MPRCTRLGSDPFQDLQAVVLLLLQIFIVEQPVGFAGAPHVDADAGIAVAGEIGMGQVIALRRAVAFAIGEILQDRRHGIPLRIGRQPDARRQAATVRQRDEQIFDLAQLARELRDDVHDRSVAVG